MAVTVHRCAVVFKCYGWDPFIEHQARRLADAAGPLDFHISIDETRGAVGPIPFERVTRFTCDDLKAAGLPMRFGVGGVLWWNPDYAHYQFFDRHPDYDHYLFVEYDCVAQCSLPKFVDCAVSRSADLVALPIKRPVDKWHWMTYQEDSYAPEEVRLALLNLCFLSKSALRHLLERRLAMNAQSSGRAWPSAEAFIPTEIVRAKMTWLSLAEFGDVSRYDWFPPTMEEDLETSERVAFLHPVLDRERYLSSLLDHLGCLPKGELDRSLSRFRPEEYQKLLWPAARRRTVKRIQHKIAQWRNQLGW